mmetsp:Transcript_4745/g.5083  ORF Transcript_4745/g.5083 Transcript_4745/m.5083 type:complete len:565 (+) Transcript_4745:133-1827(+)
MEHVGNLIGLLPFLALSLLLAAPRRDGSTRFDSIQLEFKMNSSMVVVAVFYWLLPSPTTMTTSFLQDSFMLTLYNDRWKYRRRYQRRHQYLRYTPEEQSQEVNNVSYDNNDINKQSYEANPTDGKSMSCPFSQNFPRYRLDLTMTAKRKNRKKQQQKDIWNLLPSLELPTLSIPWKRSVQLYLLERKCKDDNLTLIVKPDIDGVTAFAFLWNEAARLMRILEHDHHHENNDSFSVVSVVVLPDSSMELVLNFCEIVNWMTATLMTELILDAKLLQDGGLEIPSVHLEMRSRPQQRQQQNEVHNSITNDFRSNDIFPSSSIDDDGREREKIINERTRRWVKRVLVEQGICPFTRSDCMSGQGLADLGIKVGSIAYHASFRTHPIGLFADTWDAIDRMIEAGPEGRNGVSSILLAAPAFDDDFDLWAGPIFAMLEAGVLAAEAVSEVGVVCFHPRYATPDGKSWPGFGQMHSVPRLEKWYRESSSSLDNMLTTEQIAAGGAWQRRTPHATINVLRADQLEIAETRRNSGNLYTENINKLVGINGIGNEKLANDLECERKLCAIKKK